MKPDEPKKCEVDTVMPKLTPKKRAGRNRTLTLTAEDRVRLKPGLITGLPLEKLMVPPQGTINGDCLEWSKVLPEGFVDLLFLDPPYNLDKNFNGRNFAKTDVNTYANWLDGVITALKPLLKATASIYICGDWFSSASIYTVAAGHF
ncbi:MAG: hypothetical protein PHU78_06120, partial [Heliobacteriaceae bacterium]|nr:hypothetical protein [Heliobacteriaceae bacterium]